MKRCRQGANDLIIGGILILILMAIFALRS